MTRLRILQNAHKAQKEALRKATPRSRDRIRRHVVVLEKAIKIERENRAA
jgi:hypothetical protein